jgi:hypothetical protein
MKIFSGSLVILLALFFSACGGNNRSNKESKEANDTITVPDTGYTGITQGMSGSYLVSETTYKNGVRDGIKKTYYQSGRLRQTFWYVNGLRQDSSRWYFEEGQVFRTTPYKNDTIDGVQKQFYRTGKVKAKISYIKGLRVPTLQEFTQEGKLIGGYPQMVVTTRDDYKSKGTYRITLSLSDKSTNVRFFRGEFYGGVFDTSKCEKIKTVNGIGNIYLKKTNPLKSDYIGIIAEILTDFGNNYLEYKKIDLPYNDLN